MNERSLSYCSFRTSCISFVSHRRSTVDSDVIILNSGQNPENQPQQQEGREKSEQAGKKSIREV
jgi:hypothetical protein